MALAGKYGSVKIDGIPDDEPVFILRAKDRLAARGIEYYGMACSYQGTARDHIAGVDKARLEFERWQRENRDQVRLPDTPPAAEAAIVKILNAAPEGEDPDQVPPSASLCA